MQVDISYREKEGHWATSGHYTSEHKRKKQLLLAFEQDLGTHFQYFMSHAKITNTIKECSNVLGHL